MAKKPTMTTTGAPVPERNSTAVGPFGGTRPLEHYQPILQSLELQRTRPTISGLHRIAVIALSVIAWFLAVMWLNFTGEPKVGLVLAIVSGICVMFLTLILLATSSVFNNPRWRRPKASFTNSIMHRSLSCSVSNCWR